MKIKTLFFLLIIHTASANCQIDFDVEEVNILNPWQVTRSADLDKDGFEDLVIGTIHFNVQGTFPDSTENNIEVYLKNEAGQFVLHQKFKYNPDTLDNRSIETMELEDMNNDGFKDLIIGYSYKLAIYLQDSSHQFNFHWEYAHTHRIQFSACGDLNNDSLVDIIFLGSNPEIIVLFQNKTTYCDTLIISSTNAGSIHDILITDINNDKLQDIVFTGGHPWLAPAYIIFNDTIDGIAGPDIPILTEHEGYWYKSIAAGDMNNDSLVDLVLPAGGNFDGRVFIFYQEESALNYRVDTLGTLDIPQIVEIIDFNNDGLNDLAIQHNGHPYMSVFEQTAPEIFSNAKVYPSFMGTPTDFGWTFGHFNDDDLIDIFDAAAGAYMFYWNKSTSSGLPFEGIDERSLVYVFPNPVKELLNISITDQKPVFDKPYTIEIFSLQGEILQNETHFTKQIIINMSGYKSGFYLYRIVRNGELLKVGKILKR